MTKSFWQTTLLFLTILITGCSSTPKYQEAMTLSVDGYQQNISRSDTVKHTTFSTQEALHNNPGTTDSDVDDNYVRAVIDKHTGIVSYQIVNTIYYQAPSWRFYQQAKYVTQEGVNEQPVELIDQKIIECSVFSGCSYLETISFEITQEIVEKGAERYEPGIQAGIKYVLMPTTGQKYVGIVFAQELIAVFNAVKLFQQGKS